ncbi:M48 family metalloprotease [Methylocystis sp. IM4]|uniref:M48 family metalloprotease n=1 Tax=Methylocystis sp. IM4 TaxID=3136560 RepID=UPI003119A8BA
MTAGRFDLGSEFERLMSSAGTTGEYRLGVNLKDKKINGICSPWPWRRVVAISQGTLDAGPDVARAVLAHEVAHTRQRLRWIIPFGTVAILGAGWALGAPQNFIAPAGVWLLSVYQLYELDADRWAASEVGPERMAPALQRLGLNGRWRAWMLHLRAERERTAGP